MGTEVPESVKCDVWDHCELSWRKALLEVEKAENPYSFEIIKCDLYTFVTNKDNQAGPIMSEVL